MANSDTTLRFHAINAEALDLGDRISQEIAPGTSVHTAFAQRIDDESDRHFLCRGRTSIDAAEKGLRVLRGVVDERMPWPGEG